MPRTPIQNRDSLTMSDKKDQNLKFIFINRYLVLTLFLSLSTLAFSYAFEYLSEKNACTLCQIQRIPYMVISLASILGILTIKKKSILLFLSVLSIISLTIGAYHLSVQSGLISDPCKIQKIANFEDFRKIVNSPKPSCSDSSISLFNIPLPVYNIFISSLCFLICFSAFWVTSKEIPTSCIQNNCLR